jgi:glyceraldehyde 3-phosphate dehydrogenase
MQKKQRLFINGFGRIGRAITKLNMKYQKFDLVQINDINPNCENLTYLLNYDSTYGRLPEPATSLGNEMSIGGHVVKVTSFSDLNEISWAELDIDVLIDASGVSKNVLVAKDLTRKGALKKVVVTHSSDDVDREVILGVNTDALTREDSVVSSSICDANAIAHPLKWIESAFGISGGAVTTLHPWLSYQNLVDGPSISQSNPGVVWSDFALGRAAGESLIPKNTTALTATEKIIPAIAGKLLSFSYRIPTRTVASSDLTLHLESSVTTKQFEQFLNDQCLQSDYVRANYESLVSVDYEQDEASAILDLQWIKTMNNTVKLILWYDNEWAYSTRALELAEKCLADS